MTEHPASSPCQKKNTLTAEKQNQNGLKPTEKSRQIHLAGNRSIQLNHVVMNSLILMVSAFVLLRYIPVGGSVDLKLIELTMTAQGQFPLRDNWFLAQLNHRYVKDLLIAVYVAWGLLYLNAKFLYKNRLLAWQYGYAFMLVIVSTSLIGLLKSQAAHACPWDMVMPNGLFYQWNFSLTEGHCFPGGHASTGFALFVAYFIHKNQNKKRAYFYLGSALILGFLMGWAQMMRGAHFLSHNLWTAWVIWLINVIAYTFIYLPYLKKHQTINLEKTQN